MAAPRIRGGLEQAFETCDVVRPAAQREPAGPVQAGRPQYLHRAPERQRPVGADRDPGPPRRQYKLRDHGSTAAATAQSSRTLSTADSDSREGESEPSADSAAAQSIASATPGGFTRSSDRSRATADATATER